MQFSSGFHIAVSDYYSFLQKKYPQKVVLKLVGDRYKLSRTERSVLYRGISVDIESTSRKNKLLKEFSIDSNLTVDGLNQLLTIASYLNGNIVFISSDGYLRDASEIHGKVFRSELLSKSIDLTLEYCNSLALNQLLFYIDKQSNICEKVDGLIANKFLEWNIHAQINLSGQVDKELELLTSGHIATSDSQVIKKSKLDIFDLAHATLKFHFSPEFIDLNRLLNKKF